MPNERPRRDPPPNISDLLPGLTEEQREQAEIRFTAYLRICIEIYESLKRDPERYARFKRDLEERRRRRARKGPPISS